MNNSKSQTATEYLILLAVVIVVALVVVNALGVFPGIGSSTSKKTSDFKLANDVIGVTNFVIESNYSIFNLKNNYYDPVTVTEFQINQQSNLTCNSSNTIPALPIVLNIGQSVLVNCSVVNSSSYSITNKQFPILGISYIDSMGSIRRIGTNSNPLNSLVITNFPLTSGLILSLDFNSPPVTTTRNPYGFTKVLDNSSAGNNGTKADTHPWNPGKVGGALNFDGIDDMVVIPFSRSLNFSSNNSGISVCAWVLPYSVSNSVIINEGWMSNPASGFGLMISGNYFRFHIFNSSGIGCYSSSSLVPSIGTLYHVCGVYNTSTGNISGYINGVPNIGWNKSCGSGLNDSYYATSLTMGRASGSNNYYLNGTIDEVMLFNRTLNSTEILNIYNNQSANLRNSGLETDLNLVSYWKLDDLSGINLSDSQLKNNGTLLNYVNDTSPAWNATGGVNGTGAYQFDGVDDYINISNSIVANYWSISFYGKIGTACSDSYARFIGGSSYNFDIACVGTSRSLRYYDGAWINTGYTASANNFTHYVFTFNGTMISVYANGAFVFNRTSTKTLTGSLFLGSTYQPVIDVASFLSGSIDNVLIYNRALNASEVMALYLQ